ncbi:MAG: LysR family transcriptional regulator [Dehalobacterium sp.]
MRLEQFEYLMEIYNSKSISIAAENLYVSQPALSKAIKLLENELGVTLLFRTVSGIQLTAEGKLLISAIENIMASVENLKTQAEGIRRAKNTLMEGQFVIYTVPPIMDTFLYSSLKKMEEIFPRVKIATKLIPSEEVPLMAVDNFNDIFLLVNMNNNFDNIMKTVGLDCEILFSDKHSVIVGKGSPLGMKKIVTIEKVLEFEQIFPYNRFNQEKHYMDLVNRKKSLCVRMRTNNVGVITEELARNRFAVHIVHNMVAKRDFSNCDDCIAVPIKDMKSQFFCLYDRKSRNKAVFNEFFSVLRAAKNEML